jgi:hypothetical protein
MQWPEPATTEQSLGASMRAQTKGGAVRTRIALTTAKAVTVIAVLVFAVFITTPGASGSGTRQRAVSQHRTQPLSMKLMSYDQARRVAQFTAYTAVVEAHEVATYLQEVAYLKALAAAANTMPAAWWPTARCEEGGRNDPVAGYFGIKEWHGFDGYPTAGSAPLSVQLKWEATYIGGPPDAPGECHSY